MFNLGTPKEELVAEYSIECEAKVEYLIKELLDNYDPDSIAYGVGIGLAYKFGFLE